MNIEEEIQQQQFRSVYQKAVINLSYTSNWLNDKIASALEKYDLTVQQFNILRILRGQHPNPSTVLLLKERMLDKQSDVSRLVDRLVAKELVRRNTCPHDRRKVDIVIGENGLKLLKTIDAVVDRIDGSLRANLSETDAATLSDLLDKLRG